MWRDASSQGTFQAYRVYATRRPYGSHDADARAALNQIEGTAWQQTIANPTRDACAAYLEAYPTGVHHEEVRAVLDDSVFLDAGRTGTFAAYRAYAADFPYGRHADKAYRLIVDELLKADSAEVIVALLCDDRQSARKTGDTLAAARGDPRMPILAALQGMRDTEAEAKILGRLLSTPQAVWTARTVTLVPKWSREPAAAAQTPRYGCPVRERAAVMFWEVAPLPALDLLMRASSGSTEYDAYLASILEDGARTCSGALTGRFLNDLENGSPAEKATAAAVLGFAFAEDISSRASRAVQGLVCALATSEGLTHAAVRDALVRITGQPFDTDAEWRSWWQQQGSK
jgi:hypothetical protein